MAQVVREDVVGALGVRGVCVVGLLGERAGVQPVEQLKVHAQAAKRVLRRMDVDVAHARDDEVVAAADKREARVLLWQLVEHAGRDTVYAHGIAALDAAHLLGRGVVADVALEDE